ncbi:MAG: DUF305 domain-containing protein [Sediminibacterium sp.]
MKNILAIATISFAVYFLQSCSNGSNSSAKVETDTSMSKMANMDTTHMGDMNNEMMQAMNSDMTKMTDLKMSGDLDIDFANMMIMHHQAAIDMSQVELVKGSDARVKTMAQNIITAQKAEIIKMQQLVKNYKMPEMKMGSDEMRNSELMKTMMDGKMNMSMSGNTDKNFVTMMIPHHEAAVRMAGKEIAKGKQPELKKMAQKMIADQTNEIREFKTWLAGKN